MKAAVGQVWASTDPRDVTLNVRQERIVTDVPGPGDSRHGTAFLRTTGSRFDGSFGIKLAKDGSIPRHRYVSPGLDPQRQQDAAQRADNLEAEADELCQQALAKRAQAEQLRESWMLPA